MAQYTEYYKDEMRDLEETTKKQKRNEGAFSHCKKVILDMCCPMYSIKQRYGHKNDEEPYAKRSSGCGEQYCNVNVDRNECFFNNTKSNSKEEDSDNTNKKVPIVLECLAECCCPLYTIRRDFENALAYTPASSMKVNVPTAPPHAKEVKLDSFGEAYYVKGFGPQNNLRMRNNDNNCLYFDNFGLDDC